MPNLTYLFIFPFLAAVIVFLIPIRSPRGLKSLAVAMSLLPLALLLLGRSAWMGASVDYVWMPELAVHFNLRVDALSLLFLYLTAIITPISLLAVQSRQLSSPSFFYALVLFLQGLLIGFFTAQDLVLFTIFWEAMLLPLYFMISLWGGPKRQMAALKFLIYMLAGSILMIVAVLSLYLTSTLMHGEGTFNLEKLSQGGKMAPYAAWVGAAFVLAFAVKTPLFPFHAWLPDAYFQASTAGTILLSALLSKAGIYGFFRIGLGLFPSFMQAWSPLLLGLAVAGVFYAGFAAWRQSDFKRLIAYSSFSHVNFILAGIFVWSQASQEGALLQALNHGVTITALFLAAGWLQERLGSTALGPSSGLAKFFPQLCWLTLFFILSSVALPGTNNFVGGLLILFGLFGLHPYLTAVLGFTVVLSVLYMLRWMQNMYFGSPSFFPERGEDVKGKEMALALPLIVLILWIGIYPSPVLNPVGMAIEALHTQLK